MLHRILVRKFARAKQIAGRIEESKGREHTGNVGKAEKEEKRVRKNESARSAGKYSFEKKKPERSPVKEIGKKKLLIMGLVKGWMEKFKGN